MNIETDVIQDVKDYLFDVTDSDTYYQCGLRPYGCDLWSLLFEEPNANGTLDFSRQKSFDYLKAYPAALDYILDKMQHEYMSVDQEELYEYDEKSDEYVESDYVYCNAEAIKVTLFIDIGEVILQLCPTVESHWNDELDLDDEKIYEAIHREIEEVNVNEVNEYQLSIFRISY